MVALVSWFTLVVEGLKIDSIGLKPPDPPCTCGANSISADGRVHSCTIVDREIDSRLPSKYFPEFELGDRRWK
jgi:hypothetical protein